MKKTSDTPKLNVGIYARVSTDKQDNGNQLDQLRDFAARQGWAIAVEYVDTVTGSGRKVRPQFERMLLAAITTPSRRESALTALSINPIR